MPKADPRTGPPAGRGDAPRTLTRRTFLGSGVVVGGFVLFGCAPEDLERLGPRGVAEDGVPTFFTPEEAETVDAFIGRLIPGDEADPGAREAGVLDYIDNKLAMFAGFAQPAYLDGPYAQVIEGGSFDGGDTALAVPADQIYRYGYQSGVLPQALYRDGIPALDRLSEQREGARFARLPPERQDAVITILDTVQSRSQGTADSGGGGQAGEGQSGGGPDQAALDQAKQVFGELDPGAFFTTLRTDTIEGMFADPKYGGNRDLAGWALIGYPGARRAYSPSEMLVGTRRRPQRLHDLAPMNPDRRGEGGRGALEQPLHGVHDG